MFILICPKLKILKLINKENDGTSVIVERYIFIVCQIDRSNIYNHIKYIVWSIVCPNCCQRQYIIGFESLHMLDVDFCFIYLIKSKFNQIDRNLIGYLKQTVYPVFCCSQYTNIIPNMIKASSLYIFFNLR